MAKEEKPAAEPSVEDLLGDGGAAEGKALTDMLAETEGLGDNEGLDPNHPVLSLDEQRAARDEARAVILEEKRKAAFKDLVAKERVKLLGEEGLRTGDPVKDEMVMVTLDLAEHSDRILINSRIFMHGQTYRVQRHVADTLREIQSRGHNHQNEVDGKGIADRFRRPHNTVVDTRPGKGGAVSGAPRYQDGQVL
jgi:hypothetical protein